MTTEIGEDNSVIKNKIDLHLHIDGSADPKTVWELAKTYGIEPECQRSVEEIAASMTIPAGEFDPDFLTFAPPLRVMQTAEGLCRITRELVERLEREGLIYAELRFAPQYHLEGGMTQEEAVLAAIRGLNEGLARCKTLRAGLILCAMNHCDPMQNRGENLETLRLAKKYLGKGVCGVDLAGYEERMADYAELFDLARELGVPATTHSEFTVGEALRFGTARIGHGYQAAQLEELTEAVIRRGVTLEMCPDSSLSYDYGLTLDQTHPLYVLYQKGARVTVNTDNLTVLDTDLEKEYALCRRMGFTDRDIVRMNNFAIEASFADEETKRALLAVQPSEDAAWRG